MGLKHKPAPIKEELKGKKCDHPASAVEIGENRKGQKYKECSKCGAFLGFV